MREGNVELKEVFKRRNGDEAGTGQVVYKYREQGEGGAMLDKIRDVKQYDEQLMQETRMK